MNDIGLSLPDFGVLMGQQDRKPITGSDVTAPDDVIKSLLHSSAPYTDYEEATTALTELSGNIPDLAELMSSVVPDGSEQKQKMPSRNRAPDNWSEMPRTPLIPLTVEDVDASGQLWLKSECNGWQNSADCWSQNLCTQLSSENQPLRRWSSTSYPSASETYARQHPGFDDLGCAVVSEQPFMRGLAHSGAPSCIHGNGHQNDLQFAGNQQGTVNMYGKHSAIRTVEMDHTISSRQFTHGRSRSMSLADERFRYTSWPEGRSRPTVEEESMRTSDEFSDDASETGRLVRRRLSNKTAAQKSRQRKRERTQILKKEWLDTECDNTRLQYEINQLRKQVAELQGMLRNHKCKRRRTSPGATPQPTAQPVSTA